MLAFILAATNGSPSKGRGLVRLSYYRRSLLSFRTTVRPPLIHYLFLAFRWALQWGGIPTAFWEDYLRLLLLGGIGMREALSVGSPFVSDAES